MSDAEAHPKSGSLWPLTESGLDQVQNRDELLLSFRRILAQEALPAEGGLLPLFETLYLPMAHWVAESHQQKPLLLGINGAQGSGKSTLTKILQALLEKGFSKRVVSLSIDDLYLRRSEREQLARDVHPLLMTRGVPGTHDVAIAKEVLSSLKEGTGQRITIPVFDKAHDDRADEALWQQIDGPVDIIIFEGWCVGAVAEDNQALEKPINRLEAEEDPQKLWRTYVNEQLKGPYQEIFSLIDKLIMMKIPAMENVFEWRSLQEEKLRASRQDEASASRIMSERELQRFIMHYERITRHSLEEMPERADVVLELNDDHQIERVTVKEVDQ
jgi:D-glycerate 3-kinase